MSSPKSKRPHRKKRPTAKPTRNYNYNLYYNTGSYYHSKKLPCIFRCNDILQVGVTFVGLYKAVTKGVFWVFEQPRNFREKLDTLKQIYY